MRATAAIAAVIVPAALAAAGPYSEWNLIVRNDIQLSTSEVDGSTLIGGSVLGGTSNYAVQGVTASNGTGLAVGGSVAPGATVNINNSGDYRYAGTPGGTVNLNGGNAITDNTVAATAASYIAQAQADSAYLASLASTGSVDGAGNMNASTVTLDGQEVAVYTITQAQFNPLGQLNLNMGAADSVIINFIADGSGQVNLDAPPNIIGGFNQNNSSSILWNFVGATEITVNNSFNGMMLAPDAALSVTGGGINGTVVVDSITAQNAEIRFNNYTGYIPAPSTAGVLALAGLAAARRRRAA